MIIIGFCNLKGGVGKTTACQNIAVGLARKGKRVAVVDMDPQSNLSAGFGVIPSATDPQVFDLLSGGAEWDDILRIKEGVDIIPSSLDLTMAELNQTGPLSSDHVLRDALKKISPDRYDYILLDSPPQLGIFTRNVLAACNKIIVPMDGGYYSLFGLKLLDSSLDILSERLGNELEILGILMTNFNSRLYISRQIYDDVKKNFGDVLFEKYISQSVSLIEASNMGFSIFEYSPKSKAAQCYKEVTEELLKKLEKFSAPSTRKAAPVVVKPKKKEEKQEPEPEPEQAPEKIQAAPVKKEPEPPEEPEAPAPVINSRPQSTAGPYEEGIKQEVIDMLPDSRKAMWSQMLAPISDITRGEIDVKELREDFERCDNGRYTFYVLNDEQESLWPVMYPDQIVEPMRCVIKWDEYGSVEVFM